MSVLSRQRRLEELLLKLKGLAHVRALLETRGASPAELQVHNEEIVRVRTELARLVVVQSQR